MIEKNFEKSVTPAEILQMSTHLAKLLPTRRITFVDRYKNDAINELGKRLARKRNVMMQTFDNVEDAERWLLAN